MKKKILIPVGMAALFLLCVLASSGNDGFAGSFVSGGQWKVLVCNEQGRL